MIEVGQKVAVFSKDDRFIATVDYISNNFIYLSEIPGIGKLVFNNNHLGFDTSGKIGFFLREIETMDLKEIEATKKGLWSGEKGILNQNEVIL